MGILVLWRKERFQLKCFVPLAIILSLATQLSVQPAVFADYVRSCLVILFYLFTFRLWDDVASLEIDQTQHPERVLCKADNPKAIYYVIGVLFLASSIFFLVQNNQLLSCIILFSLLSYYFIYYHVLKLQNKPQLIYSYLRLIKYPSLTALLASTQKVNVLNLNIAMLIVFLIMMIYEIAHDKENFQKPSYKKIMSFEIILLLAVVLYSINLYFEESLLA